MQTLSQLSILEALNSAASRSLSKVAIDQCPLSISLLSLPKWLHSVNPKDRYDLIRLAESLDLVRSQLRQNVAAHCKILGCNLEDSHHYLITALAYIALHLEQFPLERFIEMAMSCLETLEKAVPGKVIDVQNLDITQSNLR